ncbi:pentatricopeptide repeat-containing protein At1g76280 isoform X2 [Dioscorea cayenensis subsp. rotundata]|nr:pentatricopeptide repeat-containing protein At1g76280 isoform X2 [Dioscorea cayenensis subsp. rotundata]
MLLKLSQEGGCLGADSFTFILEYCARTPDPMFVMETWQVMKQKAIDVNKRSCRYITQAFIRGGYFKEALKWLTFLGENDHVNVLPVHNMYLKACGNAKRLADADCCLKLMESRHLGKSEITYWELLKLAVLQKNLSAVHEIWRDCIRYYSPSIIILRKFIWSFTRLHDLQSAHHVLQRMVALVNQGISSIKTSTTGRYQSSRLDIPIPLMDDIPIERLQLKGSGHSLSSSTGGCLEETKGGFQQQNMNTPYMENPLRQNISQNLNLGLIAGFPFDSSKVKDNIFPRTVGRRLTNGEDMSSSNSHKFPTVVGTTVIDDDCTIDTFKRCTQLPWEISKAKVAPSTPVMRILRWSFNDLMQLCAQLDCFEMAEQLFLQMQALGLEPSLHTYDGFVKAAIHRNGAAYGMRLIEALEMKNIKPYDETLAVLSIAHSKDLELELAESLLGTISHGLPKYMHAFHIFLAACNIVDEPERAIHMLAKMKHLNVKPDIKTYELLYSLFGNVNVPYEKGNILSQSHVEKRIKAIEKDMMKNGIQHSYTSMRNLIRALGAEGMIEEMLRYLNFAENMLWHIDSDQITDIYNIVLHALVKAKQCRAAIDVFKNMRLCNLPTNVAIYNIMIECCSILQCYRSASVLVSMMLRDGYYPQTLTYTALVKVLLENEDFDGALSLLNQMTSANIQPDIQLFNTILRQAYSKGQIDVIEFINNRIQKLKMQPDPSTCWLTFSTYVERGFHSTAMEALQVLSMQMISTDDASLVEKSSAFEELIYNEDSDAEAKILELFKDSQEFLATALLNLRLCAFTGFSISWCSEDNPWLRRISSSYSSRTRVKSSV